MLGVVAHLGDLRRLRDAYLEALEEAERRRDTYHQAIRDARAAGASLREIAEALDLTPQRISAIIRRLGS